MNCYFCLRPSAKDQGITSVVLALLVHFLFKRNLSEKNLPDRELNQGSSDPKPSTSPLSHSGVDINDVRIDLYILPQTLDQYWSTLVYPLLGLLANHRFTASLYSASIQNAQGFRLCLKPAYL